MYQDPKFKNGTKWNIGDELWIVTGVWFTSDDPDGRHNARTDKLGVRQLQLNDKGQPTGGYASKEMAVTKDQLERSINNKKRTF